MSNYQDKSQNTHFLNDVGNSENTRNDNVCPLVCRANMRVRSEISFPLCAFPLRDFYV